MTEIPTTFYLLVRDAETIFFDGEARSVNSVNQMGKFDVLPLHEQFITLIKDTLTIRDSEGKESSFPVAQGILKTEENKVYVFLGVKNKGEDNTLLK